MISVDIGYMKHQNIYNYIQNIYHYMCCYNEDLDYEHTTYNFETFILNLDLFYKSI